MEPENDKDLRNNLIINVLPPPIDVDNENDFTYSCHLSRLLRRFVRIAVPDDDQLTFSDVELLDDVMRFGNLSTVAKKKGCSQALIGVRLHKILDQLEERVSQLENAKANAKAQERIAELEKQLERSRQHYADLEARLDAVSSYARRQAVTSARNKSMEVEAHLRERKHN